VGERGGAGEDKLCEIVFDNARASVENNEGGKNHWVNSYSDLVHSSDAHEELAQNAEAPRLLNKVHVNSRISAEKEERVRDID